MSLTEEEVAQVVAATGQAAAEALGKVLDARPTPGIPSVVAAALPSVVQALSDEDLKTSLAVLLEEQDRRKIVSANAEPAVAVS